MPPRLVLASTSVYRAQLLRRLGLDFEALAPECDEQALKRPGEEAGAQAQRLASEKARSLRTLVPDALILGGDQVVDLGGEILGKPGTVEAAVGQLTRMRGKTHRLLTAFTLLAPDGRSLTHLDTHLLRMRALSDEQVRRYVSLDRPLDCAGSYKVESAGIALFERITGDDFTAISGLPLMALSRALQGLGIAVP